MQFVADMTIPDGSRLEPGSSIVKTWRIKNTGEHAWPVGTELTYIRGQCKPETKAAILTACEPGKAVDVQVPILVPATPGVAKCLFRLQAPTGRRFGDRLWLDVIVTGVPNQTGACVREDCGFLRHSTQKHGFCCGRCRNGKGHGRWCEANVSVQGTADHETLAEDGKAQQEAAVEAQAKQLLVLKQHQEAEKQAKAKQLQEAEEQAKAKQLQEAEEQAKAKQLQEAKGKEDKPQEINTILVDEAHEVNVEEVNMDENKGVELAQEAKSEEEEPEGAPSPSEIFGIDSLMTLDRRFNDRDMLLSLLRAANGEWTVVAGWLGAQ